MNLLNRFLSFVDIDKSTGCWNWNGALSNGYGTFSIKDRSYRAHRVSYQLYIGDLNNSEIVMHSCDNPGCVSPFHLKSGTTMDNVTDKVLKLRQAYGENHGRSKLTNSQVAYLKSSNKKAVQLAAELGVSPGTIWKIKSGNSRK